MKFQTHCYPGTIQPVERAAQNQKTSCTCLASTVLHGIWSGAGDHFPCLTGNDRNLGAGGPVYPESFSAMLVADLLLELPEHSGLVNEVLEMLHAEVGDDEVFHFFKEHQRLPADADCTAIGFSVLLRAGIFGSELRVRANQALDRIFGNKNGDGIIETYFDPSGERAGLIDPVVCCNALYLAYQLDRAQEVEGTLNFVLRVLVDENYLDGTRYYPSPDTFLYFCGRFVLCFSETHERFLEPLRLALCKRLGSSDAILDLAQRVWLGARLGIDNTFESQRLADRRGIDGMWPIDALFRYGRKNVYFGSQSLTTSFAIRALVTHERTHHDGQAVAAAKILA